MNLDVICTARLYISADDYYVRLLSPDKFRRQRISYCGLFYHHSMGCEKIFSYTKIFVNSLKAEFKNGRSVK